MTDRRTSTGPACVRPVRWDTVLKPAGGIRRLVRLDPLDESSWAETVAAAAPFIRRCIGDESHASRVASWHPSHGPVLEPWRRARRRWSHDVTRLGRDARWLAVTDVRACYPSIESGIVVTRLRDIGVPAATAEEIASWLRAFRDLGVEGLPVGPVSSALIADAVLSAGDDAVRSTGAAHVRWVDDVVIFAPDRRTGIRALDALRRRWREVGLEGHDEKTAILAGPDALAGVIGAGSTASARSPALR